MNIGYSTLGCPAWTLERAVDECVAMGYDGLELRLLDGALITPDMRDEQRNRVLHAASQTQLPTLASSVRLADPAQTVANFVAVVEHAAWWAIPSVRVFGGRLAGEPRKQAIRRAADLVTTVLAETSSTGVTVALETHHDFSASSHAAELIEAVANVRFAAIWDTQHTWHAGDSAREAWSNIGGYVTEIQLKDGRDTADGWWQTTIGEGDVPARECLDLALADGFDAWIVVEWEKHWKPSLPEPEVALPAQHTVLTDWLSS